MLPRLILGYGNSLRSDDGFGWKGATALEQDLSSPNVKVVAAQQLTPELAEAVACSSKPGEREGVPGLSFG